MPFFGVLINFSAMIFYTRTRVPYSLLPYMYMYMYKLNPKIQMPRALLREMNPRCPVCLLTVCSQTPASRTPGGCSALLGGSSLDGGVMDCEGNGGGGAA